MSEQPIKILIVDDNEKARDQLIEQLRFGDVQVVGESGFGAAAYTWAQQLDVDVIVVAIEEPVARCLRTVETLAVGPRSWPVLGISSLGDRETMRKAIVAGVRDYLVRPVSPEELHQTILNLRRVEEARRTVVEQGQGTTRGGTIITVTGVKGGIGKSTVATNLVLALAEQTRQHIAMVDLDLQFGDDAVMLDLVPTRTIEDAANEMGQADLQQIHSYLTDHPSRVRLLAAPATPVGSENIGEEQAGRILEALAATHDYVVADTSAQLEPVSLKAMDLATMVLVVVVPEVPCVRRTKALLTLMQEWGYSRDKVKLIVNQVKKKSEVSIAEIEEVLQYPIFAQIPADPVVSRGISLGTPVVMSAPKTEVGQAFLELGRVLLGLPKKQRRRFGVFGRKQRAEQVSTGRTPLAVGESQPVPTDRPPVPASVVAMRDAEGFGTVGHDGVAEFPVPTRSDTGNGVTRHHGDGPVVELPLARRRESAGD
ncbi:MAG: response regulator [Chloroflexia bacterium]|nr:response regulator [Chloroflexia bacterium]